MGGGPITVRMVEKYNMPRLLQSKLMRIRTKRRTTIIKC
jgi:hypothetical protein